MDDWRSVPLEVNGNGDIRFLGRVLKPRRGGRSTAQGRYAIIALQVHRVVAAARHGPPPEGRPIVNHIDGNPSNNRPENLEWVSSRENGQRAVYRARGMKVHTARLTDADVERIRGLRPLSAREWSERTGVTTARIYQIQRGQGGSRVLDEKTLAAIRNSRRAIEVARELAAEYGVSRNSISNIWRGHTWKHL